MDSLFLITGIGHLAEFGQNRYFESLMNNEDNFVNTGGNPYDLLLQSRVRGQCLR